MENNELVHTLFTQDSCKSCKNSLWERIACPDVPNHVSEVLGEEHKHYVCKSLCDVPGFKTEIYSLV